MSVWTDRACWQMLGRRCGLEWSGMSDWTGRACVVGLGLAEEKWRRALRSRMLVLMLFVASDVMRRCAHHASLLHIMRSAAHHARSA